MILVTIGKVILGYVIGLIVIDEVLEFIYRRHR
jgi:uncharacterized membrane protein